jgi:hypothetical protein
VQRAIADLPRDMLKECWAAIRTQGLSGEPKLIELCLTVIAYSSSMHDTASHRKQSEIPLAYGLQPSPLYRMNADTVRLGRTRKHVHNNIISGDDLANVCEGAAAGHAAHGVPAASSSAMSSAGRICQMHRAPSESECREPHAPSKGSILRFSWKNSTDPSAARAHNPQASVPTFGAAERS